MNQPPTVAPAPTRPLPPAWWAYAWWTAAGALLSFGFVGLLTIGIFLAPISLALIVAGCLWAPLRNHAAIAAVGGLAAAPLYLAWLNRHGPGTVCETINDVTVCADRWSPWPFVAIALLLLTCSIAAAAHARHVR